MLPRHDRAIVGLLTHIRAVPPVKQILSANVATIGIDIGKNSFHVIGTGEYAALSV